MRPALPLCLAFAFTLPARADLPVVVDAEAAPGPNGWTVAVTVRHADTGWEHYADGWAVLSADGAELGYRELLHPHVEEQPFTRSLHGIAIEDGASEIHLRAHDNVHGWGPEFVLTLPD